MKNKPPKPISGKNDEPKVLFKIIIEQLDNSTSRHFLPQGMPLEVARNMLFTHMMLIQEQITMIHIEQKMQQVKIIKPGQIPPGMKLHS